MFQLPSPVSPANSKVSSIDLLSLPSSSPSPNPSVHSTSQFLHVSPSINGLSALPPNVLEVPVNAVKTGFVEVFMHGSVWNGFVASLTPSSLVLRRRMRSGDHQLDDRVMTTTVDFTALSRLEFNSGSGASTNQISSNSGVIVLHNTVTSTVFYSLDFGTVLGRGSITSLKELVFRAYPQPANPVHSYQDSILPTGSSVSGFASTITWFNTVQSTLSRFKGSNPLPILSRCQSFTSARMIPATAAGFMGPPLSQGREYDKSGGVMPNLSQQDIGSILGSTRQLGTVRQHRFVPHSVLETTSSLSGEFNEAAEPTGKAKFSLKGLRRSKSQSESVSRLREHTSKKTFFRFF
ncbi:hypothetical protein BC830DRAFT_1121480 [Chytriomyces sp. MP71]|nr:hypothetical protein BC830DRAFT_1121480 [Chytriomyces sp. MP71]